MSERDGRALLKAVKIEGRVYHIVYEVVNGLIIKGLVYHMLKEIGNGLIMEGLV